MDLPDFREFRESLTEEKIGELFGNYVFNIYEADISSEENISALVSKIALDVMARSANYSLNLLEAYHDWLRSQS